MYVAAVIWTLVFTPQCVLSSATGTSLTTERAAAKLLPVDWLHIQKCGSSFGNTLLKWACIPNMTKGIIEPGGGNLSRMFKENKCEKNFVIHDGVRNVWPIGDHFSLRTKENGGDAGLQHVVTFFREPVERTVSHAFFYDSHFSDKLHAISEHARDKRDEISRYEDALISTHSQGGCHQTRFQVGRLTGSCQGSAEEACDRIPRLGFVGITSLWDTSICSFYHTYGRGPPSAFEVTNTRPGTAGDVYSKFPALVNVFSNGTTEWPDMKLFRCVLRQFVAQIKNTPCAALAKVEFGAISEQHRVHSLLKYAIEALSSI